MVGQIAIMASIESPPIRQTQTQRIKIAGTELTEQELKVSRRHDLKTLGERQRIPGMDNINNKKGSDGESSGFGKEFCCAGVEGNGKGNYWWDARELVNYVVILICLL